MPFVGLIVYRYMKIDVDRRMQRSYTVGKGQPRIYTYTYRCVYTQDRGGREDE